MPQDNFRFSTILVEVLTHLGVQHACVTPGSRNSPLSLALAESGVTDWSHHDERSSAFFALGIAKATGCPVVIVTTSGTAATELHPAIAEAFNARVPLIAITADRPLTLRNVGAPQAIDQHELFGPSVKTSIDMDPPTDAGDVIRLATMLWKESVSPPAGPVHLNIRFDEPLMPEAPFAPLDIQVPGVDIPRLDPDPAEVAEAASDVDGRRGIVIAGPDDSPWVTRSAAAFAAAAGWPILADPLSGMRAGPHDVSHLVGTSDALGWAGYLDTAAPEAVVRFGAIPTSKPVWQWLGIHRRIPQVFIEPFGLRDPTASASRILRSEVAPTLDLLAEALGRPAPPSWMERWREADAVASAALRAVVDAAPFPNEPAIARTVVEAMPSGSTLWVASSMPVRDLDAVMKPTSRSVHVMANRGANGIDGFLSSALGSCASTGTHTVALAGDLSVIHDIGALATARRLHIPLAIVAVNNDGGGIFHLLPQEGHPLFERHWGTPHGLNLSEVAGGFGVAAERVRDSGHLADLIATRPNGPLLLELVTDRGDNARLHREIRSAVAAVLSGLS